MGGLLLTDNSLVLAFLSLKVPSVDDNAGNFWVRASCSDGNTWIVAIGGGVEGFWLVAR